MIKTQGYAQEGRSTPGTTWETQGSYSVLRAFLQEQASSPSQLLDVCMHEGGTECTVGTSIYPLA